MCEGKEGVNRRGGQRPFSRYHPHCLMTQNQSLSWGSLIRLDLLANMPQRSSCLPLSSTDIGKCTLLEFFVLF